MNWKSNWLHKFFFSQMAFVFFPKEFSLPHLTYYEVSLPGVIVTIAIEFLAHRIIKIWRERNTAGSNGENNVENSKRKVQNGTQKNCFLFSVAAKCSAVAQQPCLTTFEWWLIKAEKNLLRSNRNHYTAIEML